LGISRLNSSAEPSPWSDGHEKNGHRRAHTICSQTDVEIMTALNRRSTQYERGGNHTYRLPFLLQKTVLN